MPKIPAYLYTIATAFTALFQLALAAGAPWGHLAMGGQYPGVFPTALRVAAVFQAILLTVFSLIVLSKAGLILPRFHKLASKLIWLVVVMNVIALVLNAITPSTAERALWLPVALVQTVFSFVIARYKSDSNLKLG